MKFRTLIPAITGAAIGLVIALAPTAGATTSQTLHLNGVPIDLGPAVCVPGELFLTGQAVEHITVNNAGDLWETATVTGTATAVDLATGTVLATGHGQAWFGVEQNRNNFTTSFTTNVFVGGVKLTEDGQFTVTPAGNIVVNNATTTCG
jgi:hypothetical protein